MPSQADTRAHVERIARDGYTVLERAIEPALVDELADDPAAARARARHPSPR